MVRRRLAGLSLAAAVLACQLLSVQPVRAGAPLQAGTPTPTPTRQPTPVPEMVAQLMDDGTVKIVDRNRDPDLVYLAPPGIHPQSGNLPLYGYDYQRPIIDRIFHYIFHPGDAVEDLITNTFKNAAQRAAESIQREISDWSQRFSDMLKSPEQGYYYSIAQSSIPIAVALALPMYLLRLAIYHWRRLVGEDDGVGRVIGDWIVSAAMAALVGPVIDLIVRFGWWAASQVTGESGMLAEQFVGTMSSGRLSDISTLNGIFSILLAIGIVIAGLIAVAGILFAFAAASVGLFAIAVVGPTAAIVGVVPHFAWLRALLLKALLLIGLLPILAGGIFKAGVLSIGLFTSGGLLPTLIRMLWLFGAAGLMLAVASILARITLTAGMEGLRAVVSAIQGVVGLAAMAAAAGGAGAAAGGGGGAGGGAGTSAGLSAGAAAGAGESPPPVDPSAAYQHLEDAKTSLQQSSLLSSLGLNRAARIKRDQSQISQLSARQAELLQRAQSFAGRHGGEPESEGSQLAASLGMTAEQVDSAVRAGGQSHAAQFAAQYAQLNQFSQTSGINLATIAPQYPEEVGRMAAYYASLGERQGSVSLADVAREASAREITQSLWPERPQEKGEP